MNFIISSLVYCICRSFPFKFKDKLGKDNNGTADRITNQSTYTEVDRENKEVVNEAPKELTNPEAEKEIEDLKEVCADVTDTGAGNIDVFNGINIEDDIKIDSIRVVNKTVGGCDDIDFKVKHLKDNTVTEIDTDSSSIVYDVVYQTTEVRAILFT